MRDFVLARADILLLFVLIAVVSGSIVDYWGDHQLDNWVHDSALVYQAREDWDYSAIVVLDDAVPIKVGRKQALPLFAKAADRAVAAGAKGIYLDSRVAKDIEGKMPYASCIYENGDVQWSTPDCVINSSQQCSVNNSSLGNAPLKMDNATLALFSIAPYLGDPELPDFLLFDWEAELAMPEQGLVTSDRLVTKKDPIARWFDLSPDHAVIRLAKNIDPELLNKSYQQSSDNELCDDERICRRVRFSLPLYETRLQGSHLIVPVSLLASCNLAIAEQTAKLLTDRIVIFQTTSPTEATDIKVTPMTTALFGPKAMTPGAQFLADAVETLLRQDHPRAPNLVYKMVLFVLVALISVFAGAYLQQAYLWGLAFAVLTLVLALCFYNHLVQLWPVTATMATFLMGAAQTIGLHLMIGFREGILISHYMPKQIHSLLISLQADDSFQNKRCHAVVLMSDLTGYTTVTGLLQEPFLVLNLMNDYLGQTSVVLQDKYNGWLESYVGDMVCYYWPFYEADQNLTFRSALQGAHELALLQKQFFLTLNLRYKDKFAADILEQIAEIINAGIGLSTGEVVMGDLGPKNGVRKFGIIGDPLNLASRVEALTRHFNTEVIITQPFVETAQEIGFAIRRLGKIKVKGRVCPETLYAFGDLADPRFAVNAIESWEQWLTAVERKKKPDVACPAIFAQDEATITNWQKRNLLGDDFVWYLDEK